MADKPHSTTRRALLGAVAALPLLAIPTAPAPTAPPPDRALWDRRLADYRRLAAEAEEAAATGWFAAANARYDREVAEAAARFGSWQAAADHPEGKALRRAAFNRVSKAENAYWTRCTAPMQRAAVALALTPPPDLDALQAKIAVMREVQLHDLARMKRDCFEVLEEDVGRLASRAGAAQLGRF